MKGVSWIICCLLSCVCLAQNIKNHHAKRTAVGEKEEPVTIYVGGSTGKAFTNLNTKYLIDTWTGARDARVYFCRGIWRWLFEVQDIPAVDLITGWKHVNASYYDFNLHLSDEEDGIPFYPIFGITYETITGVAPGFAYAQFSGLIPNHVYAAGYWGANGGAGIDFKIYKKLHLYGEMKFRIMKNGGNLGYNELFFCCGMRLGVVQFRLRKIFRKPGDKYHWF